MSREKQENWKRTEIRMPQPLYDNLQSYAKENSLSLNSAMIEVMEKGISNNNQPVSIDFHSLPLELLLGKVADRLAMAGMHMELYSRNPNSTTLPPYKKPTA